MFVHDDQDIYTDPFVPVLEQFVEPTTTSFNEEQVLEEDEDPVLNDEYMASELVDTSNIVEHVCYIVEQIYEYFKPSLQWIRAWYNENIKIKSE